MYQLVYYVRRTEDEKVYENEYQGKEFRLENKKAQGNYPLRLFYYL